MARRKKRNVSVSRRRRVGAVGAKSDIVQLATMAAGVVAARFVVQKVLEQKPDLNANIINGGQLVLGVLAQKSRNKYIKAAASGMFINGAVNLIGSYAGVAGIGSKASQLIEFRTAGQNSGVGNFTDTQVIGRKIPDMNVIAGMF